VHGALPTFPAGLGHDGGDSSLFSGAKVLDTVESNCGFCYLQERGSPDTFQERGNQFFPRIVFVTCVLFWLDKLALEFLVGPPLHPGAIAIDRFGKKLIAISNQPFNIDGADLDRPEPACAGFVAQVAILIRGASKNALTRFNDLGCARNSGGIFRSCA
jgi:hypothetical protein